MIMPSSNSCFGIYKYFFITLEKAGNFCLLWTQSKISTLLKNKNKIKTYRFRIQDWCDVLNWRIILKLLDAIFFRNIKKFMEENHWFMKLFITCLPSWTIQWKHNRHFPSILCKRKHNIWSVLVTQHTVSPCVLCGILHIFQTGSSLNKYNTLHWITMYYIISILCPFTYFGL